MEMLGIVSSDEIRIPTTGMIERGEVPWIADRVFQGFVPGFHDCIVIAATRTGVAANDFQVIKEHRKGCSPHRITVVGVDDHRTYPEIPDDPGEKSFGMLIGF